MGTDYHQIASEQVATEEAARVENAIADRATQLRLKDEREAQLAELRRFHGMHPECTLRELADAEISHARRRRDFLATRYGGRPPTTEGVTDEKLRAAAQEKIARAGAEFDKVYTVEAAGRLAGGGRAPAITDSMLQHNAHQTGVAA